LGRLVNDRFIAHGAAVAIFVSSVRAVRAPLAAAFSGANHKGAARRRASRWAGGSVAHAVKLRGRKLTFTLKRETRRRSA
jgi:hypothetical protein